MVIREEFRDKHPASFLPITFAFLYVSGKLQFTMQTPPEEEMPKGVTLRDFDDFDTLRTSIFDNVKKATIKSFPINYGTIRMELHDVDYDDTDPVSLAEQKKVLLENKYLTKKLRGTIKLFDTADNDKLLEEKRLSLMRVPYLTNRGTFLNNGNEYFSILQSRLLPGVYTRKQASGDHETVFNVKPGTGVGFRVGFEPETTQYRVKISQANLHLYSLLKDLGTPDEELEQAWGKEIFNANKNKYDARVFDKAYERLVPPRQKKLDVGREAKIASLKAALEAAKIHARVAQKNLPNMFDAKIASEWEAKWQGQQAMEKLAADIEFKPDLTPDEIFSDFEKKAELTDRADMWDTRQKKFRLVDVQKLIERAKGRQPEELPIDNIWTSKDSPDFSEERVNNTDTKHPILVDEYSEDSGKPVGLVDGRHRLIKLQRQGVNKANIIRLTQDDLDYSAIPDKPKSNQEQLAMLIKAKQHSDQKQYGEKKRIMALMLHKNPQDFIVDSPGHMSGITHIPTGFKMHVPRNIIPAGVKRVFEDLDDDDEDVGLYVNKSAAEDDFEADLIPEDLREEYNAIYGKTGPRLAGVKKWKSEWIPESSGLGWLDWYVEYCNGKRTDEDDKQIKRWKAFKARQVPVFLKNPTPRMAFSLRNWAIDGLKLLKDEKKRSKLEKEMEEYKAKAWEEYEKNK